LRQCETIFIISESVSVLDCCRKIPGVTRGQIQAILRHANVSTTNTYYIKSAADDTRAAMAKLNGS